MTKQFNAAKTKGWVEDEGLPKSPSPMAGYMNILYSSSKIVTLEPLTRLVKVGKKILSFALGQKYTHIVRI